MAVIHDRDLERGRESFNQWRTLAETDEKASESLDRSTVAMAVRYSLRLLEMKAPGGAVEVRVAPWGAVKILDGPRSDPHNLTPPDVIELDPTTWQRLASGMTRWDDERRRGAIAAMGERDDLSALLPLV